MQMELHLPAGKHLEAVCGDVAKEVLQAVIDTFKQDLSAVYYASLRHELYGQVCAWFKLSHESALQSHSLHFDSLEEYGRFQADLAAIALCHVGSAVGKDHAVELIARAIPLAITRALEPHFGHAAAAPVAGIVRSPQDQWSQFASG